MPAGHEPDDYFRSDHSSMAKSPRTGVRNISPMHREATETSRLLPPTDSGTVEHLEAAHSSRISWQAITYILMAVICLVGTGDQLLESPTARIMEAVICYRHYEKEDPSKILVGRKAVGPGAIGGVAEMWCKVGPVQEQLASLRGYQQFLEGFPSLLLAVPFGWAADRYGRKPLLMLGVLSLVLRNSWIQLVVWFWQAFDIRMTWLSSLYGLLAGGNPVMSSIFFVVLSDVAPQKLRAGVFLRVGAAELVTNLIVPPVAAWMMDFNPWIPSLMGTVFMIASFFVCRFCPETLNSRHPHGSPSQSHPPSPTRESAPPPPPPDMSESQHSISANFPERLFYNIKGASAFIMQDWRVPALILPFVEHILIGTSKPLLMQYVSQRYGLTFSNSTLLLTILNGVRVLLLFVILPYASTLALQSFGLSVQEKDLYLARASQFFVFMGWTLVGLSPNIPLVAVSMAIASLGAGAMLLVRSFLTSLVPAHHIARVYSIISIVDTLGVMFGSPFLAALFNRGMELGGRWVGLPFYFLGVMSAAFAVLLFATRLRKDEVEAQETDEEDE
ncbi:hypothetical protein B0A50_00992 [Salinomyces thailandicus]|uniref:Major facilitator superfamily (MFS) profile domain-containing protein n=1 Tax=Salinomyces thailandicus TaxID=706561 RepID=A0A4U0UC44_9PEZI|nr:hypothetical protein B0A50_00992 [Salinomyces thailandica]